MSEFDDLGLRQAMRDFLEAADRLDSADRNVEGEAWRDVMDLSQVKSIAAITLHQRLRERGWTPPAHVAGEGLGVTRNG